MSRCPKCGGSDPKWARGPFDPPYCQCPVPRTFTSDSTKPIAPAGAEGDETPLPKSPEGR